MNEIILSISETPPSVNSAYYFIKTNTGRIIKVKTRDAQDFIKHLQEYAKQKYPEKVMMAKRLQLDMGIDGAMLRCQIILWMKRSILCYILLEHIRDTYE